MLLDLIAHSAESIKDSILRTSGTSRVSKADVQSMPYLSSKGGTAPIGVIAHGNDVVKKSSEGTDSRSSESPNLCRFQFLSSLEPPLGSLCVQALSLAKKPPSSHLETFGNPPPFGFWLS